MDPRTFSFEAAHAAVLVNTGLGVGGVFIQVLDQYGFQRELRIYKDNASGIEGQVYWVHAYTHPQHRRIHHVPLHVGEKFLKQLVQMLDKHPNLLFNEAKVLSVTPTQHIRPRCYDFVRMHERLLWGETLHAHLLN
jgi:hypothetical protein